MLSLFREDPDGSGQRGGADRSLLKLFVDSIRAIYSSRFACWTNYLSNSLRPSGSCNSEPGLRMRLLFSFLRGPLPDAASEYVEVLNANSYGKGYSESCTNPAPTDRAAMGRTLQSESERYRTGRFWMGCLVRPRRARIRRGQERHSRWLRTCKTTSWESAKKSHAFSLCRRRYAREAD